MTPGNASGVAAAFAAALHPQSCGGGPTRACTDYYCACHNTTQYNLTVYSFSVLAFGGKDPSSDGCTSLWAETFVLGAIRPVGCPQGWLPSGDPDLPCVMVQFCWKCFLAQMGIGNPVNTGNGAKLQKETDYVSPAPGGLHFDRYYNSAGYFDIGGRDPVITDYWRHNYSSRIIAYTGNAFVMAVLQQVDGTLAPFNLSGTELQNNDGGARVLQKLTGVGGIVTGWTLTTPDSNVEQYDANGRLTSITTRAGFVTTLAYDGSGRLQTATDAYGRSLTLTYDGSGNLSTMTDPAGRVYTYAYVNNLLDTVTYPDSSAKSYIYADPTFNFALTGVIDERRVLAATYAYDSAGRTTLTQHTGPDDQWTIQSASDATSAFTQAHDGFNTIHTYLFTKVNGALKKTSDATSGLGVETWTYDTSGNPLTYTDRNGNQTTYVYDPVRNLELSRTEAAGTAIARTITTTWHPTYRLPATITEPSGVAGVNLVTTYTYDAAGNLTKKNMTAGTKVREWNYTLNSRGQALTIDGPRTDVADVTTIAYYGDSDPCTGCRGQVQTVTNALSQVTAFNAYDADGRPTQITDANGVATALTYKTRGWLASRTTSGETTSYDYDPVGNLTKVTMPDGSFVSYEYDAANKLVGVDDSLGNSIDYELDVMGNRVGETTYDPQDMLKKSLQRVYDGYNRLTREIGAAGQTTIYGYDANNNVTTVTDPLSRITTNTYDALNRLTNVNDAASGNTVFTYDAKDHLATVKDPKLSVATSYVYDGLGNLASQFSPDTGTTSFTYDDAGNVASQTDARSVATAYSYDALNRVTAATVTDGTVIYAYDNITTGGAYAKGHLTQITDPSGNTTYAYDSLGRITSKTQSVNASAGNLTFAVGYSYANGRQTGITYPSGRAITYGFDTKGEIASITVDGATTILNSVQYFPYGQAAQWTWGNGEPMTRVFDQDGRISSLTLGPAAATYADLSQVFGYDNLDRMVSASLAAGQTQGFTYDANGNRTSATINAASTTYTYPTTSHKLSSLSGAITQSFTYDNAGNTTASGGATYVYDGRGRMKQAGGTTYLVNGLGQRVKKSSGSDIYFAYDEAGHLIGEYDGSGNSIEETVWLNDTPIAVVKPKTSGYDLFYIWSDNLGTPREITDTTNASRWEWANSDPFGNDAPNENPAGVGAFNYNLRFPGQYYDAETGKHHNYFRDYDPSLGRYVESDPMGLKAGPNTYLYVAAAPLVQTDQFGLANGPGVAMAWKPKPETSCKAPDDCPNAFTISYRGVCSAGDPMCGQAMQAAGIAGPYYPQKITYSLNCVLKFGIGVKATESAAVSYGLSRAAAAGIPGAAGGAAIANNPAGIAIGAGYGLDWVLKRCECHGGAYD